MTIKNVPRVSTRRIPSNVPYELMKNLKPFIESKSLFAYEFLAPLFLPVVPHDDLLAFFEKHKELDEIVRNISTFWQDCQIMEFSQMVDIPTTSPEIFFDSKYGYCLTRD